MSNKEHGHITEAHTQPHASHYNVHFPEHGTREDDPYYKEFNEFRKKAKHDPELYQCAVGKRRGNFEDCTLDKPLELHHAHIEWALQNEIDLEMVRKQYPEITDENKLGHWIESDQNLIFLCVLPGTPILMADGTEKPIESVSAGDSVISGDGTPQLVTATATKWYSGKVVRVNRALLTTSHRVLTDRGWLPASEIADQVGMGGSEMIGVAGVQDKVSSGIVSTITVEMVDSFTSEELSTDPLFHNQPVLHDPTGALPVTDKDPNVAFSGGMAAGQPAPDPNLGVKALDTAFIGTEKPGSVLPVGTSVKIDTAKGAHKEMVWATVVVGAGRGSLDYTGYVHDLSVAHNNSFVGGGVVLHNCQFHHRGHGGAHVASASDFEGQHFVKHLID